MRKIIFAAGIFLATAAGVLGQETAPPDTGTVVTTPQESPPADTQAVPPPSTPADTGRVAPPPSESAPVDTGTVITPESPPADTGAVITPPQESPPAEPAAPLSFPPHKLGIGIVFNDEAPLAIRAWFNPKVGLDVGVGLRGRRVDDSTTITDSTPTATQRVSLVELSFDLGLPVRVLRREKVDFIIRPGFGVRTRPKFEVSPSDPSIRSVETTIELEMNGSVGFEYYPFEKASFSLQAGLAVILERTGGDISNSILRVVSLPSQKGVNFSFRYYAF